MKRERYGLPVNARRLPARKRTPLAECLELTAAFLVLGESPHVYDREGFKRTLLRLSRRDLHGAVAKVLTHIPARRFR